MAQGTLVIRNGRALLPNGDLRPCDVLIRQGRIARLGLRLSADREVDASGCIVVPGLIDLHTHGIARTTAQFGSLLEYARIEASYGATTFYPTLFGPPDDSARQLRRHREETEELALAPQVGGFRIESPYLAQTGAGVSRDMAPISRGVTGMLLAAGGGHIRIWDVSPELPGATGFIAEVTRQGIVCSLAHTRATIEQARAAVEAGARLVTHLFDVFWPPEGFTGGGVYPPGLVDYILIEDRLTCEIIGDGTHVDPILVEKTLRCKPEHGAVFVTDGNFGAGLPPGRYDAPGWGLIQVDGPNNGARLVERDLILAGSALTPIDAFRNAVRLFGKDVATASRLCSTNPARLLGLNKGEIAVGRDGDLLVLAEDLELRCTIVRGEIAHQRASG